MSDDLTFGGRVAISSCLSLCAMAVDFGLLLGDEIKVIWPNVRYFDIYALVYVVTRYAGLAVQVFNIYFSLRIASGVITSPSLCKIWFRYQAVTIQLLLATVEVALMHRVYALFLRNCWILYILILLWSAQLLSMLVSAWLVIPRVAHTETCFVKGTPAGSVYFGATTMAMNFIVLFMISWRYLHLPLTWSRGFLGYVVFRDSTLSLLTILAFTLFLILSNTGAIQTSVNGNMVYYWLFCAMWISLGRLIVNQLKVAQGVGTNELTTEIEIESAGVWHSDTYIDAHAVNPTGVSLSIVHYWFVFCVSHHTSLWI
ncbi:hypothetical protein V8B97DRAFT_1562202 [Scleroderma yunnanense]